MSFVAVKMIFGYSNLNFYMSPGNTLDDLKTMILDESGIPSIMYDLYQDDTIINEYVFTNTEVRERIIFQMIQKADFSETGLVEHKECQLCNEYSLKFIEPECFPGHEICLSCSASCDKCPYCMKPFVVKSRTLDFFGTTLHVEDESRLYIYIKSWRGWDFMTANQNFHQVTEKIEIQDFSIHPDNDLVIMFKTVDYQFFSCGSGLTLPSKVFGAKSDGTLVYAYNGKLNHWGSHPPEWIRFKLKRDISNFIRKLISVD